MRNHTTPGGAGFIGGGSIAVLMADDPWTPAELDDVMDEWNGARQPRERKERPVISEGGLKVYKHATDCGGWFTAGDIADAMNMRKQTIREHLREFHSIGLFDRLEMHPQRKYRLSATPTPAATKRAAELDEACAVLAG